MSKAENQTQANSLKQNIAFKEKVGYGLGDFASNLLWVPVGMFLMFYYTDVAGMAAGVIGTIMLFSRLLDGVTDIGMGIIVDKTNSKHGKARPWLIWLAVPFAVSAVLVFSVPDASYVVQIVYIVITYNLITTLYTGLNIPYGVLNSLITQDQYERSILNIFRMIFAIVASIIVSAGTMPLVNALGGGKVAWQLVFGIIGLIAAIFFLITFLTTKERVKPFDKETHVAIPIKTGLKALITNKYWVIVLLFFVFTHIGTGINQGSTIYFAQYILGSAELVGLLSLATMVPLFVGMFFVSPFIKKFGKRNSMIFGQIVILIGVLLILVNPSSLLIVLISGVIKSVGSVPVVGTQFALLADTIEYGEWKSGVRTEGLIYSAGSFGAKVGTGVGTALIGWILTWGGYIGGKAVQADSAIFSIHLLFIYIPIAIVIIKIVLLTFYKLDKIYPQIVKDLQARSEVK